MIKFYDITEQLLSSKDFEAESIYYCNDTGNIYLDSINENKRVLISNDVVVVSEFPLAPIPNKLYINLNTVGIYIYSTNGWVSLTKNELYFYNILVSQGTSYVVNNSEISNSDIGEFIPDSSVADLVTSSNVTCTNGKATITVQSNYDIFGTLVIKNRS